MPKTVLILCTGNSCRSQMAQVIWQELGGSQWQAFSAGSRPSGYVHPMAIGALAEIGLPTDGLASEHVDSFRGRKFDCVVTVCNNAKDTCATMPGFSNVLHWPFEDPADATGSDEERMDVFRRVRDKIHKKISEYLTSDAGESTDE